jgi:hypothetical protein
MIKAYEEYRKNNVPFLTLPMITNETKLVPIGALVGFCHCEHHKGYLDVSTLQKKECIKKGCHYLRKFDDYPYWINRFNRKENIAKEKRKRAEKEASQKKVLMKYDCMRDVAQDIADRYSMDIIITRVTSRHEGEYIINYVSDSGYDDWTEFTDLIYPMTRQYNGRYILNHIKTPNGNYATINDYLYGIRA